MANVVSIGTSNLHKYEQVVKACMRAAKACKELGHQDERDEFIALKEWADKKWKYEATA